MQEARGGRLAEDGDICDAEDGARAHRVRPAHAARRRSTRATMCGISAGAERLQTHVEAFIRPFAYRP